MRDERPPMSVAFLRNATLYSKTVVLVNLILSFLASLSMLNEDARALFTIDGESVGPEFFVATVLCFSVGLAGFYGFRYWAARRARTLAARDPSNLWYNG